MRTCTRAPHTQTRRDSISAGYGARGFAGTPYGDCPVDQVTSGNYYTYNHMLAEAFQADLVCVGPRMPLSSRRALRLAPLRPPLTRTHRPPPRALLAPPVQPNRLERQGNVRELLRPWHQDALAVPADLWRALLQHGLRL